MTTIRIKLPKIDQVEFELTADYEDIPVRGNAMQSGNADEDKMVEDSIIDELDNGNVWAWASVFVKAKYKGLEGVDHLGCCSYKDEEDFKKDGYYTDMKQVAYDDLISKIKALSK